MAQRMLSREEIKALTPEQAIEIVVERLADMHEAIMGDHNEKAGLPRRPVRPEGEPAHITLYRWSPILADYGVFARRANDALDRAMEAERERDEALSEARSSEWEARDEAGEAKATLRRAKDALRDALALLEER